MGITGIFWIYFVLMSLQPFSELQDGAPTYSRGQASDPRFYQRKLSACAQAGLALSQIEL